jgi:hypothetical protein
MMGLSRAMTVALAMALGAGAAPARKRRAPKSRRQWSIPPVRRKILLNQSRLVCFKC